jgi:diguanylate cyclase (GGDEF)-like protein
MHVPGRALFLSKLPPEARERRIALAVVLASIVLFCSLVPIAKVQLPPAPIFIAVYQSILTVCDLVTVVMLLGQFHMLRTPGLLALAGGYLFTAQVAVLHALTFPGLLTPDGLLGAGPQTTAWLYMFWHLGFPIAVIAYARGDSRPELTGSPMRAVVKMMSLVTGLAAMAAAVAIAGHDMLPPLMSASRYTPAMAVVVAAVWCANACALMVVFRKRPRSLLDLWLGVVLVAWLLDIGLSAMLNGGRYDLGFYAGRAYGLAAATFVLSVLLFESFSLHARLADANERLRDLANRDSLTGMFNRRYFDDRLRMEVKRCRRERVPLSLLIVDVDHFKKYNDHYGHLEGDDCLCLVSACIEGAARRPGDIAARYGGEEFVVVQSIVRAREIPHAAAPDENVTLSIGIATLDDADESADHLIAKADAALYRAKAAGRNNSVAFAG